MIQKKSIRNKLIQLFAVALALSLAIITLINNVLARNNLQTRLLKTEIPVTVDGILANIDKELMSASIGLQTIAEDPFFKEWIINGEDSTKLPMVIDKLSKVTDQFKTKGSNFVSWKSKIYYNFADGKYTPRMVTEQDGWFEAFKNSGKKMGINVYTKHDLYGTVAFMNYRIEHNGEFLGIMSVALDLTDLVGRIVDNTIGTKGETFVIKNSGLVTVHKNQDLIETLSLDTVPQWKKHLEKMNASEMHSFTINEKGKSYYVYTHKVEGVDWILVTKASRSELMAKMNGALIISIFATLLIIAIGVWLIYNRVSPIIQELSGVVKLAEKIGDGDLSVSLATERTDEIGELVTAMTHMTSALRKKADVLSAVADGDLTVEVIAESDQDGLADSLIRMKSSLSEVLGSVSDAIQQVNEGADQISSLSQSLSVGASEQAASLEEISSSVALIGHQAQESSKESMNAKVIAGETKKRASEGCESVTLLTDSMNRINAAAREITKIIKLIDDIAFQTNLLALNAAVEAARAGQHGKGFAVVADEVRNLANRSAEAVGQTTKMVENALTAIEQGHSLTKQTTDQFHVILSDVEQIVDNLGSISAKSADQAQAINQVSAGLSQIDSVIQGTAASSEEGAATSEELAAQTHVLAELIRRFKLEPSDDRTFVQSPRGVTRQLARTPIKELPSRNQPKLW